MNEKNKKLKALAANDEDYEWYPTTDEILVAMNEDLHTLFAKQDLAKYCRKFQGKDLSYAGSDYNRETKKDVYHYTVYSILDVSAGDGRVFDALHGANGDVEVQRRYGIEIAKAQADDLIKRDIFTIGRDFFRTTLIDKAYSVIFSNHPYSPSINLSASSNSLRRFGPGSRGE